MSKVVNGIMFAVFLLLTAVAITTLAYVEMSRERVQCDGIGNTDIKNTSLAACVGFLITCVIVAFSYYRTLSRGDMSGGYAGNYGMASDPTSIDAKFETTIVWLFFFTVFILSAFLMSYIIKVKDSMKGVDTTDSNAVDASCGGFADEVFNDMAIAGAAVLLGFSLIAMIWPYGFKLVEMIYMSITGKSLFQTGYVP